MHLLTALLLRSGVRSSSLMHTQPRERTAKRMGYGLARPGGAAVAVGVVADDGSIVAVGVVADVVEESLGLFDLQSLYYIIV